MIPADGGIAAPQPETDHEYLLAIWQTTQRLEAGRQDNHQRIELLEQAVEGLMVRLTHLEALAQAARLMVPAVWAIALAAVVALVGHVYR